MIAGSGGTYLGLLSFLSFAFSVMAAVLAIDMYTLLRTGEFGSTWRVLIIASVMFVLVQALRMAELLNAKIADYGLSQIAELMFVMALAYAFFLQRRAFARAASLRESAERRSQPRVEAPQRLSRKARRRAMQSDDGQAISIGDAASDEREPGETATASSTQANGELSDDELNDEMDEDPDIEWSHSPQRETAHEPLSKPPAQTTR